MLLKEYLTKTKSMTTEEKYNYKSLKQLGQGISQCQKEKRKKKTAAAPGSELARRSPLLPGLAGCSSKPSTRSPLPLVSKRNE